MNGKSYIIEAATSDNTTVYYARTGNATEMFSDAMPFDSYDECKAQTGRLMSGERHIHSDTSGKQIRIDAVKILTCDMSWRDKLDKLRTAHYKNEQK